MKILSRFDWLIFVILGIGIFVAGEIFQKIYMRLDTLEASGTCAQPFYGNGEYDTTITGQWRAGETPKCDTLITFTRHSINGKCWEPR